MLQSIRDNSQGWIVKVIVAFIIVTFALFGVESIVSLGGNSASVSVNGVELSDKQIAIETQAQVQQMISRMGDQADPSMIDEGRIKASVIDRLVRTELLRQSADNKGLFIPETFVLKNIGQNQNFQEDGKFSQDQYQRLLRNYGLSHLEYSEMIRTSLLLQQESTAINDSAFMTPKEIELVTNLQNQTRTFKYATFKIKDFKDTITVSDDEVATYYASNKDKYMTNRKVNIAYVELQKNAISSKMNVTDEELQTEYQSFAESLGNQEERLISHILIATNDDRDEATAQKRADELLVKLSEGGNFAELAKEYSDDPGSKESGGALGAAKKGVFVAEFEAAAFALTQVGELSPATKTQYGIHVIKLDSLSTPKVPSFEDERARITALVKEQKSLDEFDRYKEALAEKSFEGSIDWSASDYKFIDDITLTIVQTGLFDRLTAQGIAKDQKFSEMAFSDELTTKDASELLELSNGNVAVLHFVDAVEPAVKPLSEVKLRVDSALKYDKARAKVKELGALAIETVKAKKDLKAAVGDVEILTGDKVTRNASDISREITRKVFEMAKPNVDDISFSGFELVNGDYTVVGLTAVDVADKPLTDSEKSNLEKSAGYVEYQQYTQFLESSATIERAQ